VSRPCSDERISEWADISLEEMRPSPFVSSVLNWTWFEDEDEVEDDEL
jgi:hypothetical protein